MVCKSLANSYCLCIAVLWLPPAAVRCTSACHRHLGCQGFSLRKPAGGIRPSKDIPNEKVLLYQADWLFWTQPTQKLSHKWCWNSLPLRDSQTPDHTEPHVRKWSWMGQTCLTGELFPNARFCHWKTNAGPTDVEHRTLQMQLSVNHVITELKSHR